MNLDFPVIGIVAILTGLLLQFLLKPLIEVWLKPTAPNHDTVIRAVALLLGVALTCLDVLIGHPWPVDGNAWLLLIGSGAVSGLTSIGSYHALTGSATAPGTVSGLPVPIVTTNALTPPPTNVNFPAHTIPQPAAPTQHVVTLQIAPTPAAPDAKIIDITPATGGETAAAKTP